MVTTIVVHNISRGVRIAAAAGPFQERSHVPVTEPCRHRSSSSSISVRRIIVVIAVMVLMIMVIVIVVAPVVVIAATGNARGLFGIIFIRKARGMGTFRRVRNTATMIAVAAVGDVDGCTIHHCHMVAMVGVVAVAMVVVAVTAA